MKKLMNIKEVMIILMSVVLITIATTSFASDLVLNTNASTIGNNEYQNAQTVPEDQNYSNVGNNVNGNNAIGNNTNTGNMNTNNTAKTYNTNTNNTDLPQTGIEDYNIGILLIIFVASAIFAYKKVQDYRNI